MMKKLLVVFIYLQLIPLLLFSQYRITGKITDAVSGEALAGAHIVIKNTYLGTYSQSDGTYFLHGLKGGKHILVYSFLGYESNTLEVYLQADKEMNVKLSRKAILEEEVVVNALRADFKTPATVYDMHKADIRKLNIVQDLPFILEQSPSMVVSSDAGTGVGYTSLRIRGTDMSRINFTLNGIPINDAESHGVWFVNMPDFASSLGQIQIQRGVGTSTNGAPAFGGSVNMVSKSIEEKAYAELNSAVGSFGTLKNSLMAGTGLINDKFAFDVRLSKIESDGYIDRAFSDHKSLSLSGIYHGKKSLLKVNLITGIQKTYQAWNGVPKARLQSDSLDMKRYLDHWLYTNSEYEEMRLSDARTYNKYNYENETDNYQQDHYQLLYSTWLTPKIFLNSALHYTRGRGYYEQFKNNERLNKYGLSDIIIVKDTLKRTDIIRQKWLDNHFYGMTFSLHYNINKINIIFGGAANQYIGDHYGDIIWAKYHGDWSKDEKEWYRNRGVKDDVNSFVKLTYDLGKKTSLYTDLQLRWIQYNISGNHDDLRDLSLNKTYTFFNPKTGIFHEFNNMNQAYLALAISNKEPSRSTFRDATANENPQAERLYDVEAAYTYSGSKQHLNVNFYYMYYKDQLVPTGKINDVGAAILTNVPQSYRAGIEMSLKWKIHQKLEWTTNIAMSANKVLNFTEYVDDWDNGGQRENYLGTTDLAFSPSVVAGSNLSYQVFTDLRASLLTKYVSKQYVDNTSNEENMLDAYLVNDLLIAYTIRRFSSFTPELGLKVSNILNVQYESFAWVYRYYYEGKYYNMDGYFPQAGRHFLLQMNVRF